MYRYNCVTLKVDKMLPIKVGENNNVARSLFVLFSIHLIFFVSNKKWLIESHEIFDNKNVNTLQENKTDTPASRSSSFVRLSRGNNTGSIGEKSNREELTNQQSTYSNHRMIANIDHLSNNRSGKKSEHSLDEIVSDSVLRPQLAVQIYTNLPDNSHHQDDSDSTGSQSKSNNMANKPINTKLIVPISQPQLSHHYQQHHQNDNENSKNAPQPAGLMTTTNHKISNPWHYYTDPTPSSSNSINNANDNNGPDSTDYSYNHQQYDTNETPTINAIITVPHSPQSINSQSDRHNNNNDNSNRHPRTYQHDSIRQQQNSDNNNNNNGNSTSSIISHILDDQVNGNIEISMNLNGDEIIIDPAGKFGRVVGNENDEDNIKQINEDNSNRNNPELTVSAGQQKYSSTSKQDKGRTKLQSRSIDKASSGISNKALRKHVSSDLAGGDQQSASEIDQINNDHNHISDGYYSDNSRDDKPEKDNDNNSDTDLDFVKTSTNIVDINDRDDQEFAANSKPKLKDIDDEIERDERSSGSRNNRFWSDNNSSSDKDVNVAGDIQTTDESSRDDRLSSNNAYYHQNNRASNQHLIDMRADNDNNNNNNNHNNRKQQQRRFSKPSSRQQSVLTSAGGAANSRKTASSKRRSSYKSDDGRDNSNSGIDYRLNAEREKRRIIDTDHQDSSSEKVSPVIIKGEDVRKFEQILDNLRALSLNNLAQSKGKSIANNKLNNKGTLSSSQESRSRQSNYDESDVQSNHNNIRNEDRDGQLAGQDAQAKSWNNVDQNDDHQQSTNNQVKRNEASSIDSECDRRNRQRQLLQRSASGDEPAFEPDSSPNIVDQDPITSSDGSDDLNDEGSQNIEREEHSGADFHNRQQQQPTGVESQNQASSDIDQLDEPKTLFVRKTILQNYYDNTRQGDDNKNAIIPSNSDELDTIHESNHDSRHGEISAHEDSQSKRQVVGRSSSTGTTNREPAQVFDNYSHRQQAEKVSTSSKTNDDLTSSPSPNKYIDYRQLDDRTVDREAELVSRDKYSSRDQIDRMRSLQHLIERAAIESSQNDKSTLNLNS